ncbi:DUF4393 domain-containing protein [Synechococcus sp. Cruz-9H2]|uniref:DUF4393 domain-containing protein n=1 Tax=unclassified Synechococcus TaxID=2626047 RepID=UPI0020CD82B3|nr:MULTISPECIES: DUF4393 domain-containing protein [unclassified Synechococcus]MCP9818606.1 DUF4393 domain-containing protein [Synechococcus sp. Cruz-9H2]MCP9842836.1 DUF4393 domain-containing protein [Synechococcus sp. Edmonson 11F2]MCP9855502.1 DUF4393 domain-containing protein [Synechococcus sp. Cruz-9C9]MCP9862252.1 DUF4393 domain-containing protein [Synechococcus sp. Cruz-7E5]MCP9869523.1 DUF4393 domain-containing protein [Synechococcus sp. Cruz-7B9]
MSANPLQDAKDGLVLAGELIRLAGEDPKAREAAAHLGEAAVTISQTINNALLPLAAVNFAIEKARIYFSERFGDELSAKAANIPVDQLVEPKASIAGPALQGLAFCFEEADLKEMYLNLLATSMDKQVASNAHPAFVEVIRQLSAEDAALLKSVLAGKAGSIGIVRAILKTEGKDGFSVLQNHILRTADSDDDALVAIPGLAAIVENWQRLGLIVVDYAIMLVGDTLYDWADDHPDVIRLREGNTQSGKVVELGLGVMYRTDWGERFAKAVGLSDS